MRIILTPPPPVNGNFPPKDIFCYLCLLWLGYNHHHNHHQHQLKLGLDPKLFSCDFISLNHWLGVYELAGQAQVCSFPVIGSENIKLNMTSWIWDTIPILRGFAQTLWAKSSKTIVCSRCLPMIKERRDLVSISRNGIYQSIIWPKAW